MNDRTGVPDVHIDGPTIHKGAAHATPEWRGGEVGGRVRASASAAKDRLRAVLPLVSGRASRAQAAPRCGVVEDADVKHWRGLFTDSGRRGAVRSGRGNPRPSAPSLGIENAALESAPRPRCGYRRLRKPMIADGHIVSAFAVRRAMEISLRRPGTSEADNA